jgi:hypothetical protein
MPIAAEASAAKDDVWSTAHSLALLQAAKRARLMATVLRI